jgi:hypothetical protein
LLAHMAILRRRAASPNRVDRSYRLGDAPHSLRLTPY